MALLRKEGIVPFLTLQYKVSGVDIEYMILWTSDVPHAQQLMGIVPLFEVAGSEDQSDIYAQKVGKREG